MRNSNGFTLIEVIVVSAVIAILAGILVPMIFNQMDGAKQAKALAECKTIANAIMLFRKDTGKWPINKLDDCSQLNTLLGPQTGIKPLDNGWGLDNSEDLSSMLNLPAAHACYNNPTALALLPTANEDPWGYQYIVYVDGFTNNKPVWVISAGQNGCLDTSHDSSTLNDSPCSGGAADDIGTRIQ